MGSEQSKPEEKSSDEGQAVQRRSSDSGVAVSRPVTLSDRNPLEKKLKRVVLQERSKHCGHSMIKANEPRYVCVECAPLDNSFDLCHRCQAAEPHEHSLMCFDPSHREPVAQYKFLADSVANRMRCYGGRRFIGTLRVDPTSLQTRERAQGTPTRHLDAYAYITYNQLYVASRSLASRLPLRPGQFVGLVGETSLCAVDWITADLACVFGGAVSVPLHYTFSVQQMVSVFQETNVSLICCSCTWKEKLLAVAQALPEAPKILVFGSDEWNQLVEPLAETEWNPIVCSEERNEIRTLFYTSGSTGQPKGVIISDRMLNNNMTHQAHLGPQSVFAYEPLGYATQRLLVYQMISCGGRLVIHSSNMDSLFTECAVASPSSFSAPPRIWGLLYAKWKARVSHLMKKYPDTPRAHIEDVVREEYKGSLGSCRSVSTGGAITPKVVWEWMEATFGGMHVSEGYGCSECGAIASNGYRKYSVRVRIEEIPELGYIYEEGVGGKGLLWVHTGQKQTQGYFNNQEKNDENFKMFPGSSLLFYNTGDIVDYDVKSERLRVIDRLKNLLRLSSAVFVAPEYLETIYTACTLIQTLFIYAASERDFVLAVVIPNKDCEYDYESIMAQMRACGTKAGLQPYEIPHGIIVEEDVWSVDNGMLTSSFKLKRLALTARYRSALRELYEQLDGPAEAHEFQDEHSVVSQKPPDEEAEVGEQQQQQKVDDEFERVVCQAMRMQQCPALTCRLAELGVDSVGSVHLQTLLGAIGSKPPLKMLLTSTLAQIKEFVMSNKDAPPERVDFEKEIELPEDIQGVREIDPDCPSLILLTGATGFLGVFILHELLVSDSERRVICLVRAESEDHGMERLIDSARLSQLSVEWERVAVACGNLALPRLGMPQDRFDELCQSLTKVIHCGARVNGLLDYGALRDVNVSSTLECLRFRCPVIFVSSLSSMTGADPVSEAPVCEKRDATLSLTPLRDMGGYGASKRVSEILLQKAFGERGCLGAIIRPGTIGGSAATGVYNMNDTLPRLIMGLAHMNAAPRMNTHVVAAMDVRLVAKIVVRAQEGVYHARGHNGVTVSQLAEAIGVPLVDPQKWKKKLWLCSRQNPLYPLKEAYFSGTFPLGTSWRWQDDRAAQLIADEEISANLTVETVAKWALWLKAHANSEQDSL